MLILWAGAGAGSGARQLGGVRRGQNHLLLLHLRVQVLASRLEYILLLL